MTQDRVSNMTPLPDGTVMIVNKKDHGTKGGWEPKMQTPNSTDFLENRKRSILNADPSAEAGILKRPRVNNENLPQNGQVDLTCATFQKRTGPRYFGKSQVPGQRKFNLPGVSEGSNSVNYSFIEPEKTEISFSTGFRGFGQSSSHLSSAELSTVATPTRSSQCQVMENNALTQSLQIVTSNIEPGLDDDLHECFIGIENVDFHKILGGRAYVSQEKV